MELVRVLPSAEDEVNVACFHPSVGGGLVYGTKVKSKHISIFAYLNIYINLLSKDGFATEYGRKGSSGFFSVIYLRAIRMKKPVVLIITCLRYAKAHVSYFFRPLLIVF